MKASIKGNISCKSENDLNTCIKTLNRFNVKHTIEENNILIDTFINVTAWFKRGEFENMLYRTASKCGKCNISVSELMM